MLAYTLLFFICIIKFVKLINEICEISLDIICHFFFSFIQGRDFILTKSKFICV